MMYVQKYISNLYRVSLRPSFRHIIIPCPGEGWIRDLSQLVTAATFHVLSPLRGIQAILIYRPYPLIATSDHFSPSVSC